MLKGDSGKSDDEVGLSPIQEASKRGYTEQIEEILESTKTDVARTKCLNSLDGYGNTALHWAASGGHHESVQYLIEQYTKNINFQNKFGDTALHRASWKGHTEVCKLLVNMGASDSKLIKNKDGKTPLDLARKLEIRLLVAPPQDLGSDEEFDQEEADSD